MALKKSELYSSLWQSCDELRGGMDASQYKDYVLVLLFLKYVSDKYAGKPFAPITIPEGSGFKDMVALKGKPDIGDQINKKIIAPLAAANQNLSQSDFPDFNDANKLGTGKEMVDRLTNLIAIYENPALDFSKNRAEGDDILGDAYEYLMRHFATESGKSKGQFYTPAEVSHVLAHVIGIALVETTPDTTVDDPTCGSGSLLLKIADAASSPVTLYGQEKDATTSGLARMNMILHDNPTALIVQGNTLSDPKFKDGDSLKTFDFVVANPPFSDKRWSTGFDPEHDPYGRFTAFGIPPAKQGDYAYLLHIVRTLKPSGKGACILPHGVLFRGNAEAAIRKKLVRKGYIKGIIGLPANLFYGTGIPACIIVIDKAGAAARKGIFMVDASSGFLKDGNKNRLRSRDIHQIIDVFTRAEDVPGYARLVPSDEIEKNDFNLNLPRYIDNREAEDIQDIDAHLRGGIPQRDLDALGAYWDVCPGLRKALFKENRPGYRDLVVEPAALKAAIAENTEFATFVEAMSGHFRDWRDAAEPALKALAPGCHPKEVIREHSESLLAHYRTPPLVDHYAVYQHLMDYWAETMQDDVYLIALGGWKAETYRVLEKNQKTGKERDKGWACDLIPKPLIVARYFAGEQEDIDSKSAELESVTAQLAELAEEHGGEDGAFSELEKVNKAEVARRLKEVKADPEASDEAKILNRWLKLNTREAALKKAIRDAESALDAAAYAKYPKLAEDEIKSLVVGDKWLATLEAAVSGEIDRITQALTTRVKDLADRYAAPLPEMTRRVVDLEAKVNAHLERMGFAWS
ncbi:MAG: N-6 DNA methylase [Verrucomicrobiales bacterium]